MSEQEIIDKLKQDAHQYELDAELEWFMSTHSYLDAYALDREFRIEWDI